ncbi:DUF2510 domain-containing protein [Diaminobutyricibacter sp. McL0608]|uniref:DUF2510 domain-containing protein n=1 Tax=Leifsonia sp. McL0608 TaxID=3143537 RepID=UPI0031F2E160
MSTPPGWFPNPSNPEEEVYWDGDNWTGDIRPIFGATTRTEVSDGTDLPSDELVSVGAETPMVKPKRSRRRFWIALAIVVAVVLVGGVTTTVLVSNVQAQQVADQKAAQKRLDAARAKNAAEAKQAADDAKKAADDAERAQRQATVSEVEASVKKLAQDDIAKNLLTGPVIAVTCNPVSGSTDDLTDTTTTFDCFVANKDNGDGTQSGYFFNATVNWTTGEYTYGLGKSGS